MGRAHDRRRRGAAGVGKTTIYRRYPSRLDLVLAAAERLAEEKGDAPDTGTLRGDLIALADAHLWMLTETRAGRAIPAMVAATARHPELAARVRRVHRGAAAHLGRAVRAGDHPRRARADVDVPLLLDLLVAPSSTGRSSASSRRTRAYVANLVDAVVRRRPRPRLS